MVGLVSKDIGGSSSGGGTLLLLWISGIPCQKSDVINLIEEIGIQSGRREKYHAEIHATLRMTSPAGFISSCTVNRRRIL